MHNYPIAIHKEKGSDYGVSVPDLPGCITAGSTIDEAMVMAKEAIELHLEGMIEEGMMVPEPGKIENHRRKKDFKDVDYWAMVTIDLAKLPLKTKRINITFPEIYLDQVDRAIEPGDSRSAFLVRGAMLLVKNPRKDLTKPWPGGSVAESNISARNNLTSPKSRSKSPGKKATKAATKKGSKASGKKRTA